MLGVLQGNEACFLSNTAKALSLPSYPEQVREEKSGLDLRCCRPYVPSLAESFGRFVLETAVVNAVKPVLWICSVPRRFLFTLTGVSYCSNLRLYIFISDTELFDFVIHMMENYNKCVRKDGWNKAGGKTLVLNWVICSFHQPSFNRCHFTSTFT